MPQFTSTPMLEVFYSDSAQGTYTYSYNSLPMLSVLTDESQLQIIWRCSVVIDSNLNTISVASFSEAEQELIQTLSPSMYTVNATDKTVALIPGNIQGGDVVVNGAVYTYSDFDISSATPLFVRRSTDITSRAVNFQPGSRLTSEILNTANSQVFNSLQELAAFGSGGGGGAVGEVDISSNSINQLSNVDLTSNGVLSWDGFEVTSGSAAGSLVPPDSTAQTGMVLVKESAINGDIGWRFVQWPNVYNVPSGQPNRISLAQQISNMSSDIQSNTSRSQDNKTDIAYSAYVTIGSNAYQNNGSSARIEATSSQSGSSDVNLFRNSSGNTFSNMDSLVNFTLVGDTSASNYTTSAPFDCLDSDGNPFITIGTSNDTENAVFKKSGLYRVDLSGIFSSANDPVTGNATQATGGFRIQYNDSTAPFTQNPISALPTAGFGSEFISCSFMIPVSQDDVDNAKTFGFLVTSNIPSSGTTYMTCSRIQFSLQRIRDI